MTTEAIQFWALLSALASVVAGVLVVAGVGYALITFGLLLLIAITYARAGSPHDPPST